MRLCFLPCFHLFGVVLLVLLFFEWNTLQVWGRIEFFSLRFLVFWASQVTQFLARLPETNSSPPQIDGWKINFPFRMTYFQGELLVLGRVAGGGSLLSVLPFSMLRDQCCF